MKRIAKKEEQHTLASPHLHEVEEWEPPRHRRKKPPPSTRGSARPCRDVREPCRRCRVTGVANLEILAVQGEWAAERRRACNTTPLLTTPSASPEGGLVPIMVHSPEPPVSTPRRIRGPLVTADDPRHGTANGYKNHGCRCSRCREAAVARSRQERAAKRPADMPVKFDRQGFCRASSTAQTDVCIDMPLAAGERPRACLNGRQHTAARVVWILTYGDPGPFDVAHSCDRGREGCVNPRHLYLATRQQNVRDGHARGLFPRRAAS